MYRNVARTSTLQEHTKKSYILVPECKDMSNDQRLRYLKIYSLKERRDRGDLTQTYKIFQGIDTIHPGNVFAMATYKGTRNQGNKLRQRYRKTDIRKFSFI